MTLLFSLIALCLSFLLISFGMLFLFAPFATDLLLDVICRPHFCSWLGGSMAGFGLLLILIFYRFSNRRSYVVKMGGKNILKIEAAAIAQAAGRSLGFPCEAVVRRKGVLEFLVDLPYLSEEERESELKRIENDLASTLAAELGYEQEFLLNVRLRDSQ